MAKLAGYAGCDLLVLIQVLDYANFGWSNGFMSDGAVVRTDTLNRRERPERDLATLAKVLAALRH